LIFVLLDTNTYLRLAKRVRPMLGRKFGEKDYVLTVLKDVEEEVRRNSALRYRFPWFDDSDLAAERVAAQIRLSAAEHKKLDVAASVLRGVALSDVARYMSGGRSPPSDVDCRVLAFRQIREAVVVTDDLGMHLLANDFDIPVWHGCDLLARMRTHKVVNNDLVRGIYAALEANGDLTETWIAAKHTTFIKIFGKPPR